MGNALQTLQKAISHHQAGQLPEAEAAYLEVIKSTQSNVDALRLLGGLYLQVNQPKLAEEYLRKASAAGPRDPETINNLGIALRNQGRYEEAAKQYQAAIDADPNYFKAITNLGNLYLDTGDHEKALAALRRALALKPDNAQAHFNIGNALREQGKHAEAIAAYEEALRLAPYFSDAATNLGLSLGELGRTDDARAKHEEAIRIAPNNFRAHNNLGNILREIGKTEEAERSYLRALELKPDYDTAQLNLGTVYRDMGRLDKAAEQYEKVLAARPDSADARINYGTLMLDMNRHEDAVARYDAALELRPQSSDAQWGKALALLALGQYEEGWRLHEAGWGNRRARGFIPYTKPTWQGEAIAGKKLLLWSEQGLGDSLQFVRYADLCKQRGAHATLSCPAPLVRLFKNCPYLDRVESAAEESACDYQISLMSLPSAFKTTLATIPAKVPYLFIDDAARAKWAEKFAPEKRLRVGLVWTGSPREHQSNAHLIDRRRSITLETLRPLLELGAHFYSLQLGKSRGQIADCGLGADLTDFMPAVTDFLDTAAIIENLDLVISVDTSVVHLAGGLGKPVWVLSRFDACWRWLRNRESSPWYPTARVFGQPAPGAWEPVVEKVRENLRQLIEERR